jgi:hypothetical protein
MQLIFNSIFYFNFNVDPKIKTCLEIKNDSKDLGLSRFHNTNACEKKR